MGIPIIGNTFNKQIVTPKEYSKY